MTRPESDFPAARLAAACAELEHRLRAGGVGGAAEILREFADLATHSAAALELIYTEFVVREELGQRPSPQTWYVQFPQWERDLRDLFLVNELARARPSQPPR